MKMMLNSIGLDVCVTQYVFICMPPKFKYKMPLLN